MLFPLRKTAEPPHLVMFDVTPPPESHFTPTAISGGSAISPDGRTLAYVATDAKGSSLLYVRALNSLEARSLPGTENAIFPIWSPDSKSLAFGADSKLKRIDLAGGSPITLCDAPFVRGGSWSEEGVILFGERDQGLNRIGASGGVPVPVTKVKSAAGERNGYPHFLPGGDRKSVV